MVLFVEVLGVLHDLDLGGPPVSKLKKTTPQLREELTRALNCVHKKQCIDVFGNQGLSDPHSLVII